MNPPAVHACKQQSEGISTKKKLSVLPNSYSLALICAISCAHVAHHLAETYGVQSAGIFGEIRVDLSYGMIWMHSVEVIASLVLGLVVMKAQNLLQSSSRIGKKNQNSVLPNCYSSLLICAVFCVHAAHNLRRTYGVQDTAGQSCVDNANDSASTSKVFPAAVLGLLALSLVVVTAQNLMHSYSSIDKKHQHSVLPKFPSLLLVCSIMCTHVVYNMRDTTGTLSTSSLPDSASISKVFPAAVLGLLALSLGVVTAQNLMHSYSSIDKKHQHSVLPKFPSLLLVCSIMCTHVVYNMRDTTGTLSTSSLPDTNDMDPLDGMIKMFALAVIGSVTVLFVVVVQTVMQQSNSVDNKGKKSVLPNAYSIVIICGIFCAHVLHHFASVYSVEGPAAKYMISSALPLKGIVEMFPPIGFLFFSVAVMALRTRSNMANTTTKKVSVLPNLWSIVLICWVLCFHVIHNLPEHTSIASPDARVGTISDAKVDTILGASSAMQRFGHKEHGVENIPAEVLYSIPESGVGAGSTGVSNTSPKALIASVLFAFIGITLKMGRNSNDKKGKKSLLPNSRSMLLVCCIFFGHVVHNWPGRAIEYSSQASAYTGADEVASWDESGPVLPDTAEDLDNLLEVSPDLLTSR